MRFFFLIFTYLLFNQASLAENIPVEIKEILKNKIENLSFRVDGLPKNEKTFWLVLKPRKEAISNGIELVYENEEKEFLFSNNWIFIPVKDETIKSFNYYPNEIKSKILDTEIIEGFVMPKNFSLPRDLAMLAGERPISLRNIELESSKEELFKSILDAEKKSGDLRFLGYSFDDLELNLYKINTKENKLEKNKLEKIENNTSFINQIKTINNEIFFSDYNAGVVYKVVRSEDPNKKLKFEKVIELPIEYKEKRLKDFSWNREKTLVYLLTAKDSELLIINNVEGKIIKKIKLKSNPNFLRVIRRGGKNSDLLIYASRADNKIEILSDLDYRVKQSLDLKDISPNKQILDIWTEKNFLWIGLEKDLLIYDTDLEKFSKNFDLEFNVHKILSNENSSDLFIIGNDSKNSFIAKFNKKDFLLDQIVKLDLDLDKIKEARLIDSFILISSPSTKIIGLVEIKNLELVKKINTELPINLIEML